MLQKRHRSFVVVCLFLNLISLSLVGRGNKIHKVRQDCQLPGLPQKECEGYGKKVKARKKGWWRQDEKSIKQSWFLLGMFTCLC